MSKKTRDKPPPPAIASYWEQTRQPLQSLYFLLPLLLLYEFGAWWLGPGPGERLPPIFAERLMFDFFEIVGIPGTYLPGILAAVVLLIWHILRKDPWRPAPKTWGVMWLESVALAIPLLVLMAAIFRQPIAPPAEETASLATLLPEMLAAQPGSDALAAIGSWPQGVVFSIGAGIYEELLFRLIAISLIHMVLSDLLALPEPASSLGAIVLSALLFSIYHFESINPLGWSPLEWSRFGFYLIAGLYFAAVYVLRGFGIVVAAHAAYDVIVITQYFWSRS
ncbi:CPBP family intramembrane glutamic endopeptidase [Mucisphaera sp.]|uniref:CPBP family intramembrane glutamic endopeptidase n=1 Tax=Mucisphaera sp. TaxID=2913024 RepID=UPI003D125C31